MDNNEARIARYTALVAGMLNPELVDAFAAAQKVLATADFGSDLFEANRIMSGILKDEMFRRMGGR